MYFGLLDMEVITGGFFKAAAYYLKMGREIIVLLGISMAAMTGTMLLIGFFVTLRCDRNYHGRYSSCFCSILGSRVLCGIFWFFVYFFNICWLAILSLLVLMTSAYFCFLPICLPQAGTVDQLCFNFTLIASAIGGGGMNPSAVSLILCGGAIDKFCKLTKAIVPWYWGAYGGCVAVLIGLAHFNGSLAANYAHVKHAVRYRKIRRRTKSSIEWTKDWRVKSIRLDSEMTSRISTVSEAVAMKETNRRTNGYLPPPDESESDTRESDSTNSDSTDFEAEERRRLTRRPRRRRITSNGSIIVHRRPTAGTYFFNTATNFTPPPYRPNVSSKEIRV